MAWRFHVDGVAIPRHRRDVVPVTASARRSQHCLISTQVVREEQVDLTDKALRVFYLEGCGCVDAATEKCRTPRRAPPPVGVTPVVGVVRRSLSGGYGPLYQAAYMLGGLQIRALQQELVGGARWTERAFHDAVLHQGSMPIAVLRAALREETPPKNLPDWEFATAR